MCAFTIASDSSTTRLYNEGHSQSVQERVSVTLGWSPQYLRAYERDISPVACSISLEIGWLNEVNL